MAGIQERATHWGAVLAIVGAGMVASLQVGKLIIAAPWLRQGEMKLDLAAIGSLAAVFSILSTVGGIAAGGVITRFGARRLLLIGLSALIVGTLLGAWSSTYTLLLATRVIEGLGFLFITVAGPAALQRLTSTAQRDVVFALWSCYMPAGIATAMLTFHLFDDWRVYWEWAAAAAGLALLCVAVGVPAIPSHTALSWRGMRRDTVDTLTAGGPAWLALIFMLYSLMFFTLFTFLPVLLTEGLGLSLVMAGFYSATAVAANIVGTLGAGVLLARGWRRSTLITAASAVMGSMAWFIFAAQAPAMMIFLMCVVFSAVGGLVPSTLLGTAPLLAPRLGLAAISVGLLIQGSSLGQVMGPVMVGAAIDLYGWRSAAWLVMAAALGNVLAARRMRRIEPHPLS